MNIIVNTYPICNSGGAIIVRQFISSIIKNRMKERFIIFADSDLRIEEHSENIEIIYIKLNRILSGIAYWQFYGVKRWLKKRGIKPDILISLANSNIIIDDKKILNINYYHQAIPLYREYKWNILKRDERTLWLYKNLFRLLICKGLSDNSYTFVQLPCIQQRFSKLYNRPKEFVRTIMPSSYYKEPQNNINPKLDKSKTNMIYPATYIKYKNHEVLFEALRSLKREGKDKFILYLTISKNEFREYRNADEIEDMVKCTGAIEHDELAGYYRSCDALLFPSYIESFGLPLLEAASLGEKIISSDSDFAHDMLDEYEGIEFCKYNDADSWAKRIEELEKDKNIRYKPFIPKEGDGWKKLFDFIKSKKAEETMNHKQ